MVVNLEKLRMVMYGWIKLKHQHISFINFGLTLRMKIRKITLKYLHLKPKKK